MTTEPKADRLNSLPALEVNMNPNEYLLKFFAELHRLVDGHGTKHAISTTQTGSIEIRLGAGDWYRATQIVLDEDPIKAARDVATVETYWPDVI